MKTVFILCDALKSLYLTEENMPFLYSLSQKGYYIKQIIPCAGFCERSEIFSGLDGYDTGNFTAIGYMPENSPYRNDGFILNGFDIIKKISPRVYGRIFPAWRQKKQKRMGAYRIPVKSLKCFALTEDGTQQLIPHREIFQVLEERKMTYTMDGFTSLADLKRRTTLIIEELAKREIKKGTDFIPLYIGETDSIGHRYGDDIKNIRPTLLATDKKLEQIYEMAVDKGYAFCVMGDHGMVPVSMKLDVIACIEKTGCKLHKDYEAFYDSTMARFWFFTNDAKEQISNTLKDNLSEHGFMVNENNCSEYRIPLDIKSEIGKSVYGDLIWCANPGVLICPDYFHSVKESENGMHGYVEEVEGHGTGLFVMMYYDIIHKEIDKAHSSQICSELCQLLGITPPNDKAWKRRII